MRAAELLGVKREERSARYARRNVSVTLPLLDALRVIHGQLTLREGSNAEVTRYY